MEMVKKAQQLLKEADKEGKEAAIAREAATKKVSRERNKNCTENYRESC